MAIPNHITKAAIVGVAGGNSGSFMMDALLKTGKHTITALTRVGGQNKFPQGVVCKTIDYSKLETLVDALQGQDALVITLNDQTPRGTGMQLMHAAGEAGVPWILPNEWGPDTTDEETNKDVFVFPPKVAARNDIANLGKSSYVAVATGFWYEWSLAIPPAFGVDFVNRSVTLFDDGETKISTSMWPQIGRAVAALLSLPIQPKGEDKVYLEMFKNKVVYVKSFTISQKDMFHSALRVTGTTENDWQITSQPVKERYLTGLKEMQQGSRAGFAKMIYSRIFYPDGHGDFEHGKGTINALLDLPEEDLDQATEAAIERSKGFPLVG